MCSFREVVRRGQFGIPDAACVRSSRVAARIAPGNPASEVLQNTPLCKAVSATSEISSGHRPPGAALDKSLDVPTEALSSLPDDLLEIGVIRSAHGLRGEMKVEPLTSSPEDRLGTPGPRWMQAALPPGVKGKAPPVTEVRLVGGRKSGNEIWLVRLSGINNPEDVKSLNGSRLLIRRRDRELLTDEDEFYVQDLVGLTVKHAQSGAQLGRVVDMYDGTGTHDVMRVLLEAEDPADNRVMLVPFVKDMVPSVDTSSGIVVIDPPEGLMETSTPATRKHRNPRNKPRKL